MNTLTDLYLDVYNSLELNKAYEKSYIINLIMQTTEKYTKNYISIAFEKCVVNNPR